MSRSKAWLTFSGRQGRPLAWLKTWPLSTYGPYFLGFFPCLVTPPHRKFKKDAPDWYEAMYERRRKAHSSRRIRGKHGIAHLKNWRALTRHLGRREHMSDTVQAVAALLSHQQTTDLNAAPQS
jgi:hypothetical protein